MSQSVTAISTASKVIAPGQESGITIDFSIDMPIDAPTVGRPKTVSADYLNRLRELVSHNPRQFGYSFERWTAQWLQRHLAREFDCIVSDRHINRLLKQMGLSTRHRKERSTLITIADLPGRDRA
jgi:transposase